MKPATKNIETKRKQWELPCMSGGKKRESLKQKGKKYKIPNLNNKKSTIKTLLKRSLKPEAGEGEKSFPRLRRGDFPNRNVASIVTERNDREIQKPCPGNGGSSVTKPNKIPSNMVYSRKFCKYDGSVRKKLKTVFKSNFMRDGQFDEPYSKYNNTDIKAYVVKYRNKKNKSLLKYSMCSSGFDKEMKKKKRSVRCKDLPGKGTYNHRFAYDEALQLHKKGIDVDVLYKVKNKTDSIYVINGEFLWTKCGRRPSIPRPHVFDACLVAKEQNRKAEQLRTTQELAELDELEAIAIANEKDLQKELLARIASIQKAKDEQERHRIYDELFKERNARDLEKQRRTKELNKMRKTLIGRKKLMKTPNDKKIKDDVNKEKKNLSLPKMQQNLVTINKKNDANTSNMPGTNPLLSIEGSEAITDPCVINDIERWALRDDCAADHTMSWLKIVSGRINSLDGRLHSCYKNEWMRTAIDKVVDTMTGKKCLSDFSEQDCSYRTLMCRKSVKVSSCSFVVKTRRALRRFHRLLERRRPAPCGIRGSPAFSVCWCRDNPSWRTRETTAECDVCET